MADTKISELPSTAATQAADVFPIVQSGDTKKAQISAINHDQLNMPSGHAPANAQKNSDITQGEIEAQLTGDIATHTHNTPEVDFVDIKTGLPDPGDKEGRMFWDNTFKTLNIRGDVSDVTLQVGQEFHIRVKNTTGSTIENGSAVIIDGASVGIPLVIKAIATSLATADSIGIATHDIVDGTEGVITKLGRVGGLDTSAFSIGDTLFLSDTTAGEMTVVQPVFPSFSVLIGKVVTVDSSEGVLLALIEAPRSNEPITFAEMVSNVNQVPSVTTPIKVTFNVNNEIQGITHSETVNPEDIIIQFAGVYAFNFQPQIKKISGNAKVDIFFWVRVNDVSVPDSAIKMSWTDTDDEDVIILSINKTFAVDDKVNFMMQVSATANSPGLYADAVPVEGTVVPSAILSINKFTGT